MRPALLVVPIAIVTACGGGASHRYAGMTAQAATTEALSAATHDAKSPQDPLHGRPLQLLKLVRSQNDVGEDAWVVVLNVGQGERACVWVWAVEEMTRTTINYSVDICPKRVLRAPAEVKYG